MYKKLILVLVLVAALLLDAVPVYAATQLSPSDYLQTQGFDTTAMDEMLNSYSLDKYNYVLLNYTGASCYYLWRMPKDLKVAGEKGKSEGSWNYRFINNTDNVLVGDYLKVFSDGTVEEFSYFKVSANNVYLWDNTIDTVVYSTTDIYTDTSCSGIFFHKAPTGSILQGVAEQVNMKELTIAEILGLLPSVIGLMVFSLGLRKAYRFLMMRLKAA